MTNTTSIRVGLRSNWRRLIVSDNVLNELKFHQLEEFIKVALVKDEIKFGTIWFGVSENTLKLHYRSTVGNALDSEKVKNLINEVLTWPLVKKLLQTIKGESWNIEISTNEGYWSTADSELLCQWISQAVKYSKPIEIEAQLDEWFVMNDEVKGIHLELSGRLEGVEKATIEKFSIGQLDFQFIRTHIDYKKDTVFTGTGTIGIKLWVAY